MHITEYQKQEQRDQLVNDYQSSGLTKKDCCKDKGISKSAWYRWINEYKESESNEVTFLPFTRTSLSSALPHQSNHQNSEIRLEIGAVKCFVSNQSCLALLGPVIRRY